MRPGPVALDLTGQAVPDGDVPGRFRRVAVELVVPELRVTSRCDGTEVYEQPEERPAGARNQGEGHYDDGLAGRRNRGRFPAPACAGPPAEPDRAATGDGVTSDQLEQANRLTNQHRRRPAEDPRTRKCPDCRADGTCPRAAWAEATITRFLRTHLR
ncbi:hypothetical protein D0Q02_08435 [Micromonospora craniellae]|uniref:Uncharacterized protein n=1 Tax=Micromonospora craniellae TaxID=2294034 RepID=A0A372G324_9ACTN|nr:hypothetical protein D0Q02_08435 [Micromonospora craniellae]